MTWVVVILLGVLAILVAACVLEARRLDRLHTLLMKSRRALEHAMTARADAARDFAASGGLDPASSLLLAEEADTCLRLGRYSIASDGLELMNQPAEDESGVARRLAAESALTRALRLTVDELAELEGLDEAGTPSAAFEATPSEASTSLTPEQAELFAHLQRARLDVKMTRSFHNSHVDQIRRLRRNALVRVFRLAGGAPLPHTVDLDDE